MAFGLFQSSSSTPAPEPEPPAQATARGRVSFVGAGVVLSGALQCDHDLTVQGTVRGPIRSKGQVVVESGGNVEGDITAGTVLVRGRTAGNLAGGVQVHLQAGSQHQGTLETPSLAVDHGAIVAGQVRAGRITAAAPADAESAPEPVPSAAP